MCDLCSGPPALSVSPFSNFAAIAHATSNKCNARTTLLMLFSCGRTCSPTRMPSQPTSAMISCASERASKKLYMNPTSRPIASESRYDIMACFFLTVVSTERALGLDIRLARPVGYTSFWNVEMQTWPRWRSPTRTLASFGRYWPTTEPSDPTTFLLFPACSHTTGTHSKAIEAGDSNHRLLRRS